MGLGFILRKNELNGRKKQQLMFEQEMQFKQLLPNQIYYHYHIS